MAARLEEGRDGGGGVSDAGFVDVVAGRLFDVRDGAGPAVVLAHGAPTLDHRMWARQAAVWSEGFTVVRYDLRGYGRSSIPEAPYRHCDDLAALVAALDLGTVVIGGNSFGATVALDTALTHPSIVAGLILAPLAPLPGWSWVEGFPLAPALKLAGSASTEEVVEAILALPMNEPARAKPEVMAVLSEMARSYSGWHFTHRDPGRWGAPDGLDRLGEIAVPTLTVTGDRDVADVQMIADTVVAAISEGRRVTLAGVGHSPNLEDPESFDRVSLEFLARAMA